MKDMTGSLKPIPIEDRKTGRHPTARGSCMIDGVRYWISGWTRTEENEAGEVSKWISLAYTPVEKNADEQTSPPAKKDEAEVPHVW